MARFQPKASSSRRGNSSLTHLVSCSSTTSGAAVASQSRRCGMRALTELTFQVATVVGMGRLCGEGGAAAAGRGGVGILHHEHGAGEIFDIIEFRTGQEIERG